VPAAVDNLVDPDPDLEKLEQVAAAEVVVTVVVVAVELETLLQLTRLKEQVVDLD
jgi:hypothetical protein|tara:strand:- start:431 stop:595 length:165 start_codon:yes stop_codon:yes gene_type:complete